MNDDKVQLTAGLIQQRAMAKAKTNRIETAKAWLEEKLREHDGPWPRSSAIFVITAKPMLDAKGQPTGEAYLEQNLLPDMDFEHIIASLRQFADKLELSMPDEDEDEEPHAKN